MQREMIVKGRSLGGSSDLTLLAPIKAGFVDALDSVTHKTRIKRVLEVLHGARTASHEHASARFLSDSVERVGVIHSVRVAVLEPEDKVLLAVTFDGPWEAYIRVLWDKVGTLLDLIFFDTVDYVTAFDHGFEAWRAWGRRVQVETGFFYGPSDSTARDGLYWRRVERMRERPGIGLVDELRAVLPSAEESVDRFVAARKPHPGRSDDPVYSEVLDERMVRERVRYGLRGLASLYRLTDLYRPGTADGDVLRRAALDALREFVTAYGPTGSGVAKEPIREARDGEDPAVKGQGRFVRQLNWLLPEGTAQPSRAGVPSRADGAALAANVLAAIQGGVVRPYEGITHGVIVFISFDDCSGAHTFVDWVRARLTPGNHAPAKPSEPPFHNVAFTLAGLRALGLSEDELELFPEEFRAGMATRAGALGDVRNNHPLRWRLLPARGGGPGVDPGSTHAALILRCITAPGTVEDAAIELDDTGHPLQPAVLALRALAGVRVVATQSLKRLYADPARTQIEEHFRFLDGNGQPEIEAGKPRFDQNLIHLGEVLIGQTNASDAKCIDDPNASAQTRAQMAWLGNGSFLVMRKYRQFAGRFEKVVETAAGALPGGATEANKKMVHAKMMGRWPDGTPAIDPVDGNPRNNFVYADDAPGACPLHAHIRLANPRAPLSSAARPPRLMRRSMSYGPRYLPKSDDKQDRGIVFMSFSASIAEQYEVVQRWLNGGNSSGSSSGQGCPFIGVPDNGVQKVFRFEYPDPACGPVPLVGQVNLDPAPALFEEPSTLTRLEWGVYLFTPALATLDRLRKTAAAAAAMAPRTVTVPWQPRRGREIIAALERVRAEQGEAAAVGAWKAAIEDPDAIDRLDAAALWASIREDHGGLLKTPYGTLVASRELLVEVLRDRDSCYSVSGQFERMEKSFGGVALGLDAGVDYWQQSDPVNNAIHALTTASPPATSVYQRAFDAATKKIDAIVSEAQEQSATVGDKRFEVGFDAREVLDEVLACLSESWFGLQQASAFLARGSADWNWRPGERPLYPGHFTALSRYMFQPHPGPVPTQLGQDYGTALRAAMRAFVDSLRPDPSNRTTWRLPTAPDGTPAPIAKAIFLHPVEGHDNDFVARTMVGVLMGFTPTIIGALLNVLREWFAAGDFGALRVQLAGRTDAASAAAVIFAPMAAAARMRPMPQIAWRSVRKAHRLGPAGRHAADLAVGDKLVLAFVSGTQQSLADGGDGLDSARLMFGGQRTWDGRRDHPTHACPGYEAGIEAMLGTLCALLARPETLRAGSSATAFLIEGDVPPLHPASTTFSMTTHFIGDSEMAHPSATITAARTAIRPRPTGRKGRVVGWGDSWLDYRLPSKFGGADFGNDLRDQLKSFGYAAPEAYCAWETWPTIGQMTAGTERFCEWLTTEVQTKAGPLRAVVLSGGGNDVTGLTLQQMLENYAPGSTKPFKTPLLDACMKGLEDHYTTVITAILACLDALEKGGSLPSAAAVPVVIHGYDYPYPVGKSPIPGYGLKEWLVEPFEKANYKLAQKADFDAAVGALRVLMERFRLSLATVAGRFPGRVRQVDLLGTIASCWPGNPMAKWANDLHATNEAYEQLAIRVNDAIEATTWP